MKTFLFFLLPFPCLYAIMGGIRGEIGLPHKRKESKMTIQRGTTISETGYTFINRDGKTEVNINTSSIYTTLIQEAGRWCESYASDIIYDIEHINRILKNLDGLSEYENYSKEDGSITLRIGFRENGVDDDKAISHEFEDPYRKYYYYRAIWKLVIAKTDNKITMTLTKE